MKDIQEISNKLKAIAKEIEEESSFSGWLDKADRISYLAEELEKIQPKEAFVVTSGCYSAYTIEHIFLDEDKAKEASKAIHVSNDAKVETHDIEDYNWMTKSHKDFYEVSIEYRYDVNFKDDEIRLEYKSKNEYYDDDRYPNNRIIFDINMKCTDRMFISLYYKYKAYDTKEFDKARALRICRDDMAQIKYLLLMGYSKSEVQEVMFPNYNEIID